MAAGLALRPVRQGLSGFAAHIRHLPRLPKQAAGVRLPSSCRQGMCGTCKLTLVDGRVDMAHQGGIRPREIQRGGFLPCCSRPETDLVIDA